MYGLKQASRLWYSKLSKALKSKGKTQTKKEYSLFSKNSGKSIVFIAMYADDVQLTGTGLQEMHCLKEFLDAQFKVKYHIPTYGPLDETTTTTTQEGIPNYSTLKSPQG